MNEEYQGHGFVAEPQEENHFILGASQLPQVILQPTGSWQAYLPLGEPQSRPQLETCNCTAYGTLTAIEILTRRLFNTQPDFSERFVGIMAGTRPPGNSPHTACEAIRKYGLIEESLLPFNDSVHSIIEYYSPDPMIEELITRGREWLSFFDFGHEWTWKDGSDLSTKQSAIKEALNYSPVALSTYAWVWNAQGIYTKPHGLDDNHWTVCVDYKEGEYWLIFDSYDPFLKKIAWDTDFMQAKRFHLAKRDLVIQKKISLLEQVVNLYRQMIQLLTTEKMKIPNLLDFCNAIKSFEGWFPPSKDYPNGSTSWKNKNPGNIRCNAILNRYATGVDPKGFCVFSDEQRGFQALTAMVQGVINGTSTHYKPEMTLNQFFSVYAPSGDANDPLAYARFIGQKLSVDPAVFTIKQLS